MLVNLSCDDKDYAQTINSLKFADKVKNVEQSIKYKKK